MSCIIHCSRVVGEGIDEIGRGRGIPRTNVDISPEERTSVLLREKERSIKRELLGVVPSKEGIIKVYWEVGHGGRRGMELSTLWDE